MSAGIPVAILCVAILAGCNRQDDVMIPPDMAVAPGTIRFDSGKLVQVIGYERCPTSGYTLIGRVASRNMEKHCTIVRRESSSFDIHIGTTVGVLKERWTVQADAASIKLVRPDGDGATIFKRGG